MNNNENLVSQNTAQQSVGADLNGDELSALRICAEMGHSTTPDVILRLLDMIKPVSPAGDVEVPEVVAYICNGGTVVMMADQKNAAIWNAGHPLIEIQDHRAIVTRLTAERDGLERRSKNAELALRYQTENYERSKSELTKARELIADLTSNLSIARSFLQDIANGNASSYTVIREMASAALDAANSPAAENACTHSEANKLGCPECGKEFK